MHGVQRQGDDDALDATTAERLSRRLRMARHRRGLTLKALADAAGCSESLLSKIENGKAFPSLPTLDRLSRALEAGIGWLLDERGAIEPVGPPTGKAAKAPATRRGAAEPAAGAASPDPVLQCRILHVEAGATSAGEPEHAGEEAGYLVGGQLELVVGGRVHVLKAGDIFSFRSDQPHSLRNVGVERASVFWVNATPPA